MTQPNSPVIIRQPSVQRWTKPGLHTYNARRRFKSIRERISKLSILQLCLAALGLAGIGYYTYTLVDEYVYQSFQNWAFDQGIAGRTNVTFSDYLSEGTPFGFLTRENQLASAPAPTKAEASSVPTASTPAMPVRPANGALLGRLAIDRLHLSAMVREGVDDRVLRVAVGHVPATALAGQAGNFAIAAHRDTLFRSLKDIRNDDLVTFETPDGSTYQYRVAATQVVKPSDVSVLRSDGGGLITDGGSTQDRPKLLTMITCYPFSYIGSAPKRFIVEAKLVQEQVSQPAVPSDTGAQLAAALPPKAGAMEPSRRVHPHTIARTRQPLARANHFLHSQAPRASQKPLALRAKPVKKKSFWRKIFGNG